MSPCPTFSLGVASGEDEMHQDLVEKLENRAHALRELAQCRVIAPEYREALNAAADLYEARATSMARRHTA